jgi:hypothetical protein
MSTGYSLSAFLHQGETSRHLLLWFNGTHAYSWLGLLRFVKEVRIAQRNHEEALVLRWKVPARLARSIRIRELVQAVPFTFSLIAGRVMYSNNWKGEPSKRS